jgi:hypothetical protein
MRLLDFLTVLKRIEDREYTIEEIEKIAEELHIELEK